MSDDHDARDQPIFRPSVKKEVDDELSFHLAMRARDLAALGRGADADRRAAEEFGNLEDVAKQCREIANRRDGTMRRTRYLRELGRDVQFAIRRLARRPAFAALTIGTIALGVGAATGIFSVVDGVLLRALPFKDPARIMAVWLTEPRYAKDPVLSRYAEGSVVGSDEYFALRDRNTMFEQLAIWTAGSAQLAGASGNDEVEVLNVSASMLPLLGMQPARGRGFRADENVYNGPKVAMVGWEAWQSRFGGDPAIIGRHVTLDDDEYDIVGVLPRGLRVNRSIEPVSFWLPALQSTYDQPGKHNRSYRVIGRIKAGVSITAAEAEAAQIFRLASADSSVSARITNWQVDQTRTARTPLLIILVASGLLLLIGCVNVAMLMLSDAASRDRELAARIALGASRLRVVRQLLAESLTIAVAGGLCGTAIAWALTRTLIALAPSRIPGMDDAGLDWRMLAFAIACAACAGMLFGLAPAIATVRGASASLIRVGTGQSARNTRRAQSVLVAVEISLSLVLLVGAALLTQSLRELSTIDPGFRPADLAVVRLTAPNSFYRNKGQPLVYYEEGVRRLRALPGLEGATAGAYIPFAGGSSSSAVAVEGREYDAQHRAPFTEQRAVLPDYFTMLRIPLREGRTFDAADVEGSELIAIISAAAARRDFPGERAVGRLVKYQGKVRRIVGVVGDVRSSRLGKDGAPAIYVPLAQLTEGAVSFVVRTQGSAEGIASVIRPALHDLDPTIVVKSVDRLPALVARSYGEERYRTVIVAVFAMLAGILAVVGLYGVTMRAVTRRGREVGIRVALGATPAMVTWLMMRDTIAGALLGVLVGLPMALVAGSQLAPYLFQVGPRDPAVLTSVLVTLVVVALAASGIPARRAARSSPAIVLAGE